MAFNTRTSLIARDLLSAFQPSASVAFCIYPLSYPYFFFFIRNPVNILNHFMPPQTQRFPCNNEIIILQLGFLTNSIELINAQVDFFTDPLLFPQISEVCLFQIKVFKRDNFTSISRSLRVSCSMASSTAIPALTQYCGFFPQ